MRTSILWRAITHIKVLETESSYSKKPFNFGSKLKLISLVISINTYWILMELELELSKQCRKRLGRGY